LLICSVQQEKKENDRTEWRHIERAEALGHERKAFTGTGGQRIGKEFRQGEGYTCREGGGGRGGRGSGAETGKKKARHKDKKEMEVEPEGGSAVGYRSINKALKSTWKQ
jgi:hypothetical protein